MGQDAAFEEGAELVLDELRQVGSGGGFGLHEEGRGVLLHQAVQRGLPGAGASGGPSSLALRARRAVALKTVAGGPRWTILASQYDG